MTLADSTTVNAAKPSDRGTWDYSASQQRRSYDGWAALLCEWYKAVSAGSDSFRYLALGMEQNTTWSQPITVNLQQMAEEVQSKKGSKIPT